VALWKQLRLNKQRLAYLTLAGGVAALAFSPIFANLAQVNGLTATFYRTSVAATVLLLPFPLRRRNYLGTAATRPGLGTALKITGLGGLIFAINNGLFNTAITLIPASNVVFLANTAVIWVGLFSIVLYREKLSLNFWLGIFLALAGVFLITAGRNDQTENLLLGSFVALLGGFFYGLNILFNEVARRTLNALAYMVLSNFFSAALLFIVILLLGLPYTGFTLATYGYLFGLGFISQALGFLATVYSLAYLPPSRVSTILLAQPLLALVLAFFILREQPSELQLVGMVALFTGIVLANRRA
jgi:drug/metabolite transporter (DMT)-like permease